MRLERLDEIEQVTPRDPAAGWAWGVIATTLRRVANWVDGEAAETVGVEAAPEVVARLTGHVPGRADYLMARVGGLDIAFVVARDRDGDSADFIDVYDGDGVLEDVLALGPENLGEVEAELYSELRCSDALCARVAAQAARAVLVNA